MSIPFHCLFPMFIQTLERLITFIKFGFCGLYLFAIAQHIRVRQRLVQPLNPLFARGNVSFKILDFAVRESTLAA